MEHESFLGLTLYLQDQLADQIRNYDSVPATGTKAEQKFMRRMALRDFALGAGSIKMAKFKVTSPPASQDGFSDDGDEQEEENHEEDEDMDMSQVDNTEVIHRLVLIVGNITCKG